MKVKIEVPQTIPQVYSSMEIKRLRKSYDVLRVSLEKRRLPTEILTRLEEVDNKWRDVLHIIQNLRAEKNQLSAEYAKSKNSAIIEESKKVDELLKEKEKELKEVEENREKVILGLPNLIADNVPLEEAEELEFGGEIMIDENRAAEISKTFPNRKLKVVKQVKAQYDILREFDLSDEEKGAELAGSRFYYMKNELTVLDLALSFYAFSKLTKKGFYPLIPPYLVKRYVEERATTLDAFEETLYKTLDEDELFLIPTAEHPLAAYFHDKVFNYGDLPLRLTGFSAAFRREAGAHGKDTKGIFRNHHFNKVEQYVICTPEQAEEEISLLIENQIELLSELNIPYRAIVLPAWDTDKKAMFQVDVEGWFPAQATYRELGSHGYMGSWQAVRLNIKYHKKGSPDLDYAHTIYGTYIPVERTLAAMLENNYDPDANAIRVPKVLADLTGIEVIKPKDI
jgi:seryl-tRNA synthetase